MSKDINDVLSYYWKDWPNTDKGIGSTTVSYKFDLGIERRNEANQILKETMRRSLRYPNNLGESLKESLA